MSSSSVISDVTQTLEELLRNGQLPKDSFDVSLKSPADEKSSTTKPKVNLFLFRVTENPYAKNQGWQPVGTDGLRYPPLVLNLSYVLTPYAENKLDEQRVFGEAMRVLYENAVIPAAALKGGLENTAEELKVDLCSLSLEQTTQVWNALAQPYRLSACYEVRMVQIDSLTEQPTTRVRQVTMDLSQNA
jgi:hypothetical protein